MLRTRSLAAFVALSALAASLADAQDRGLRPEGVLLRDALPPGADLVIHVPSLPKYLESAIDAGLGTRESWSEAFEAQLAAWGDASGQRDALVRGGRALLAAADGEALLASLPLPRVGTQPQVRATILAFRTTAKEGALAKAVADVLPGLKLRWAGDVRDEVTAGRRVASLQGQFDGIWMRVQDGLVAAADHPLALGILFRGMERVDREGGTPAPDKSSRLEVRWGTGEKRWSGWTFLAREGVSWKTAEPHAAHPFADTPVFGFAMHPVRDVPLLPLALPEWAETEDARKDAKDGAAASFLADGSFALSGAGWRRTALGRADAQTGEPALGMAKHGGWLRAFRDGSIPLPIDGISRPVFLDGPVAAADAGSKTPVHAWRGASAPGELSGPAWHGPATALAIRTLNDIVAKRTPPGAPPPVVPQAPGTPGAVPDLPLPPPAGVPEKPRAPLPPPPPPTPQTPK